MSPNAQTALDALLVVCFVGLTAVVPLLFQILRARLLLIESQLDRTQSLLRQHEASLSDLTTAVAGGNLAPAPPPLGPKPSPIQPIPQIVTPPLPPPPPRPEGRP